eukprot:GGOE01037058.1.p1 GENE.GGOE01037058.1~~GGOE01037058.1.p1  ORF type:complete len:1107 (-),score=354.22 GGOE01037058.1:224-3544(-)
MPSWGCCGNLRTLDDSQPVKLVANEPNPGFPSNYISTTKYTVLTFLPLNLFEQFRRLSNIYFLLNVVVSLIPGVSPVSPATTIAPLVFVLAVAAIKDGIEDIARWRADKRANGQVHQVLKDGQLVSMKSADIGVGDIIKMVKDEFFPADLVFLSSCHEDGACYIETANLDGETTLKPKQALAETQPLVTVEALAAAHMAVEADPPNASLVQWEGTLEVNGTKKPLELKQFLFRGCKLRNTDWCYGVVCYAGSQTKMMKNLKKRPQKMSLMDKKLNNYIFAIFAVNLFFCILLGGLSIVFQDNTLQWSWYLKCFITADGMLWLTTFLTYFSLLSFMIPISLFVTIEVSKACQAKFMEVDERMVDNGRSMKVKTSNLNEDLGQIRYIFTDKTGTLTDNIMRFACCRVLDVTHIQTPDQPGTLWHRVEAQSPKGAARHEAVLDFVRCLLLCNTCILSMSSDGTMQPESSSQDEVALVKGMMANNCFLQERTSSQMKLLLDGREEIYHIAAILPFTNERKRMTMILRHAQKGHLVMYTKGADSSMLPVCTLDYPNAPAADGQLWSAAIAEELHQMATEGLRTLVMGMKYLTEEEFNSWAKIFEEANLTMGSGNARAQKIEEACHLIEAGLILLGCSGIEDKLQDRVPETIKFFLDSGVVIWMLTGDKRETAVNIAGSAHLTAPGDQLVYFDGGANVDLCQRNLEAARTAVTTAPRSSGGKAAVVLVVDGMSLATIQDNYRDDFFQVAQNIKSAVCCRLTPLQKASIVEMFQKGNNVVCLGIGDGANDVSMIQEARVGIGIMGLEGSQAELASDYAIPRFRHLVRLCAVHGRFSCVRNAYLIQFSFFKNNFFVLMQVFFAFYNGFAGQTIFDDWIMLGMNILFSQLTPFLAGIFEKDCDEGDLEQDPLLYRSARNEVGFNEMTGSLWLLCSIVHAVTLWFGCIGTLLRDDINYERTGGMWNSGNFIMSLVVPMVLVKASLHLNYWTWIMLASIAVSLGLYIVCLFIYSAVLGIEDLLSDTYRFYDVAVILVKDIKYWCFLFLYAFGWLVVLDYTILFFQRTVMPTYTDLVNQIRARGAQGLHHRQPPLIYVGSIIAAYLAILVAVIVLATA